MLSDEEKKAIERLNKRYEFFKENPLATNVWLTLDIHNLGIALNLIKKQSKEIEELKKYEKYYEEMEEVNKKFISVDKIKAKIEEIKEEKEHYLEINDEYNVQICDCIIEEYESLLEKE